MNFFVRAFVAPLAAAFFSYAGHAQASPICYVIVASETNVDALKANPAYPRKYPTWVIKTSNNRFAASIGWLHNEDAPQILHDLKASGRIAPDSFCMPTEGMQYTTSFGSAPSYTSIAELHPQAVPAPDPTGGAGASGEADSITSWITAPDAVQNAQSDIVVKGLSWAMTPRQMISALTERGMSCRLEPGGLPGSRNRNVVCEGENYSRIRIKSLPHKISIDCETINTCKLNYEDTARALLDFLPIREFKPNDMIDTPVGMLVTYCGYSPGGNMLCTTPSNGIELYPGQPGGASSINLQ